jgi:hypothetical protein
MNINKTMAIRRCPYCKAIIDEGSEYCSNCGTQLLFPEDESIQEEIPGEKIVEEDLEESQKKRKASSKKRKKEKREKREETKLSDIEEEEESAPKEAAEGEVQLDVSGKDFEEEINEKNISAEELEKAEKEDMDILGEEEILEEPRMEEEAQPGEESAEESYDLPPGEGRDEYFVEEDKEASIKTEDLEKIIDPEEKEKAEIEKFLQSLKEDRGKWGEIPPTDEFPPWAEEIKEKASDEIGAGRSEKNVQEFVESRDEQPGVEEEEQENPPQEEESLGIEEEPGEEQEEKFEEKPEEKQEREAEIQEEDISAEEELHPSEISPEERTPDVELPLDEIREKTTPEEEMSMPDTSMGLPEGVEQERLPFDNKPSEMFRPREKLSSVKLPNWVKSRAFDVLFIAAIWIVTIHIASRMMATNLFRLISAAVLPVIAFYLVLLGVYLFLFFLFLGQTLGDHLFPHEE